MTDINALLYDNEPKDFADKVKHTIDLYNWALNCGSYESPYNPWPVFLDLIGFTEEEYGEREDNSKRRLDYLGLSKLAPAVEEYTDRPDIIYQLIRDLIRFETGEVDEEKEEDEKQPCDRPECRQCYPDPEVEDEEPVCEICDGTGWAEKQIDVDAFKKVPCDCNPEDN